MELYLDFLVYAPYVTAVLLCFVTLCFFIESKHVLYQSRTYTSSLILSEDEVRHVGLKRRKLFTIIFRKKPTKEATLDDEDPPFYFTIKC